LAYLKRLEFDELKIDRSFIADVDSDELSVPIVRSIIQLSSHPRPARRRRGGRVSGVETVPLLRRAGHLGPIFLFSQLLCDLSKTVTLPLDVWPISKLDQATLLETVDAYATQPPATYGP
jgi:hypothetical protein